MKIELTAEQADQTIAYLQALSDRLTRQHAESFSGVDQFLIMSNIQSVDSLVVEIRDQVEAQSEVVAHA